MEESKDLVGMVLRSKQLSGDSTLYLNLIETLYEGDMIFLNSTPVHSLVLATSKELSGTVTHMIQGPERYLVSRSAYEVLFESIHKKEQFETLGPEIKEGLFPLLAFIEGHLYCEPDFRNDCEK